MASRGTTAYLPDGRAPLYPPQLVRGCGQPAARRRLGRRSCSHVRVDPHGGVGLDGAERAVDPEPGQAGVRDGAAGAAAAMRFAELARRIARRRIGAVVPRGSSRPEQEVVRPTRRAASNLRFRPRLPVEEQNAALSLADQPRRRRCAAGGRHRAVPGDAGASTQRAQRRLRHTARAFGLDWPSDTPTGDVRAVARRATTRDVARSCWPSAAPAAGPRYVPYRDGPAPVALGDGGHVRARDGAAASPCRPLRRDAPSLAVANGEAGAGSGARRRFRGCPGRWRHADDMASQIERAVIDLAEVGRCSSGQARGNVRRRRDRRSTIARRAIQLCDLPRGSRVDRRSRRARGQRCGCGWPPPTSRAPRRRRFERVADRASDAASTGPSRRQTRRARRRVLR